MNSIAELVESVLTAAQTGFGGPGEPPLPARVYRVHRAQGPTWDCDLLAAGLREIRPSSAGNKVTDLGPHHFAVRFVADIHVTIVRCGAPLPDDNGNPPTVVALDTFAERMAADAQALHRSLTDAWNAETLAPGCEHVTFGPLTPLSPSGGMAGWQIVLAITL